MSREQWGHGYHKGVEDAKKGKGEPRFIVAKDCDGYWWRFYIIRERHGDRWALEDFTEYSRELLLTGMARDFDEEDVDLNYIEEIDMNEFPTEHKLFYSKMAAVAFLVQGIAEFQKRKGAKYVQDLVQ